MSDRAYLSRTHRRHQGGTSETSDAGLSPLPLCPVSSFLARSGGFYCGFRTTRETFSHVRCISQGGSSASEQPNRSPALSSTRARGKPRTAIWRHLTYHSPCGCSFVRKQSKEKKLNRSRFLPDDQGRGADDVDEGRGAAFFIVSGQLRE